MNKQLYRIVAIAKCDAHYDSKEEYIGKLCTIESSYSQKSNGWCSHDVKLVNEGYFLAFFKVRLKKV